MVWLHGVQQSARCFYHERLIQLPHDGDGLLLVALIVAGRLAFYFHGNAVKAGEQVKQQEKTLAQQTGLITTLRADDARNRAMMAEQQRREQQLHSRAKTTRGNIRMPLKMTSAPAALLTVLFLTSCAERTPPPPAPLVLFPLNRYSPLRATKIAG